MTRLFVPYEKLSKKQKRELDREKRGSWGAVNPVTKRPERSDAYKRHEEKDVIRKQARCWKDDHSDGLAVCYQESTNNDRQLIDGATRKTGTLEQYISMPYKAASHSRLSLSLRHASGERP